MEEGEKRETVRRLVCSGKSILGQPSSPISIIIIQPAAPGTPVLERTGGPGD